MKQAPHVLAAHLRRLAELVEKGDAVGSVQVEHGDPRPESFDTWIADSSRYELQSTGTKYQIEIVAVEAVETERIEPPGYGGHIRWKGVPRHLARRG